METSFLIMTLLLSLFGLIMSNDIWQPVTLSMARLNGPGNIANTFISSFSDIVCAMVTSKLPWASLYCFDAGVCRISSFMAAPYESVTPISDPVECMTKLIGCNYNNNFYSVGEYLGVDDNTPLCSLLWCQKGGMMTPNAPPNMFPKNCSAPFTQTAYGCFYINSTYQNFCNARKFCLSIGGDLWTNSYLSSLALFNQALNPSGCWDCHIGMYGIGPNTYWINGSVATSTYMAVRYSPRAPDPPFATDMCVAHINAGTQYFQSNPCSTDTRTILCEKAPPQ